MEPGSVDRLQMETMYCVCPLNYLFHIGIQPEGMKGHSGHSTDDGRAAGPAHGQEFILAASEDD